MEKEELENLKDEAIALQILLTQTDRLIDPETENGKIFAQVGFADPRWLSPYLKRTIINSSLINKDEINRLRGIVLFTKLLLVLDQLSYEDAQYLRKRLSHGFRGLGGSKRLIAALEEIENS
jgi:hypothetical protein